MAGDTSKTGDGKEPKGFFGKTYQYVKPSNLKERLSELFSSTSHHVQYADIGDLKASSRKAYGYAEAHRLREKITNELKEKDQKTLVITSPHDGAGNSFLISVLALNAASFSSMEVLVVDMNMRYPQMHAAFDQERNSGFTDVIKGVLSWEETVKETDFKQLKIITAGEFDFELARHLNRPNIEDFIDKAKEKFDFVLIDTSPLLSQNRNNVDPSLLSTVCDKFLVQVTGKKTTKTELDEAITAIAKGGGKMDGIVYNKRF